MVITDNVERFMAFAGNFTNLADHFLMATTGEPTVAAKGRVLAIPHRWRWPANFPFIGVRRIKPDSNEHAQDASPDSGDGPAHIKWEGPARMIPLYLVDGEGRVSAVVTPHLPREAIELMTRRPLRELIRRRVVWFPSPRYNSKDAFLTDLRVAHERGVFPAYFDRLPTSDAIAAIGGVQIPIPASALIPSAKTHADKWKRALLKITRLEKGDAQAALLDLPDAFTPDGNSEAAAQLEVVLFEFTEIGRKVVHPALLIR